MREMPASVPISLISHSYRFTEEQVGGGGGGASVSKLNLGSNLIEIFTRRSSFASCLLFAKDFEFVCNLKR